MQLTNRELARQATAAGYPISEGGIRKAILAGRVRSGATLNEYLADLESNGKSARGGDFTSSRHAQTVRAAPKRREANFQVGGETITDVRLIKEKALAKNAILDVQEREGLLADTDGMRKAQMIAGRMVREAIESIPAKISAELAAESDIAKVMHTLENTIRDALDAVAQQLGGE